MTVVAAIAGFILGAAFRDAWIKTGARIQQSVDDALGEK